MLRNENKSSILFYLISSKSTYSPSSWVNIFLCLFSGTFSEYISSSSSLSCLLVCINTIPVYWPDERPDAENNVMKMIADHKFDLIVNIPKNHSKRELTNGYRIRRGAIDHNIPLITNARLASAFIEAFCELKLEDIAIKNWQEYK